MATTGHVPAMGFHAGSRKYVTLFGFSPVGGVTTVAGLPPSPGGSASLTRLSGGSASMTRLSGGSASTTRLTGGTAGRG